MKKQHAKKWIKALRSGKYRQTNSYLRDGGGFCCLGVLDDIFPEMNLSGDSTTAILNYHEIGLNGLLGEIEQSPHNLAGLNDQGYTFDEIADVIQIEYVEGL